MRLAVLLLCVGGCGVDPTPPGSGSACETETVPADVFRPQYLRALCARWEECGWDEAEPCLEAMNDGATCTGQCSCLAAEDCYTRVSELGCGEFAAGAPTPCAGTDVDACFESCI